MRLLIIGSLGGELGAAARMAVDRGARVDQVETVVAALQRLRGEAVHDLVLCDVAHDIAGLVRALTLERQSVSVVACGSDVDGEAAAHAIRSGAREFLPLPPDPELIAAILVAASGEPMAPIAQDPLMIATMRRAAQVANSEASILITGESGTGKEVLARFIHRNSRRCNGPFVALNCAAIPENLLESELFGHEKGAFSGAIARRIGKFESAEKGTLLLDEISEMDVRLQAKLLRTIQEREIDRLGGSAPVAINVRLLATSNRKLIDEVACGRFREDLFFRLNVVGLVVPPLRDRPADIRPLAEHYARHYAAINGLPNRRLSQALTAWLASQTWRGNVRELENVIHRAVLLSEGHEVDVDGVDVEPVRTAVSDAGLQLGADFVGRRVVEVERDLILGTLSHTLGNRTHAATILGISIRALRNKLREYALTGCAVTPPASGVAA